MKDKLHPIEPADDYNPDDDLSKGIDACYEAIRARVVDGGANWEPKPNKWEMNRPRSEEK